jgi:ABC-type Fe3+ transport system substrate-binding protein
MKILIYIDNLIDTFYKAHNDYPSKIKMTLETYNKLIVQTKEENLEYSWLDFLEKNYKGIPIEIIEKEEIILE